MSTMSGNRDSINRKKKPFTKEDYIAWHDKEAPSWRRHSAYFCDLQLLLRLLLLLLLLLESRPSSESKQLNFVVEGKGRCLGIQHTMGNGDGDNDTVCLCKCMCCEDTDSAQSDWHGPAKD